MTLLPHDYNCVNSFSCFHSPPQHTHTPTNLYCSHHFTTSWGENIHMAQSFVLLPKKVAILRAKFSLHNEEKEENEK